MKPVNIGGHAAYQKLLLDQLCKYYPCALTSLDAATWEIMEQFWSPDLLIFTESFNLYSRKVSSITYLFHLCYYQSLTFVISSSVFIVNNLITLFAYPQIL